MDSSSKGALHVPRTSRVGTDVKREIINLSVSTPLFSFPQAMLSWVNTPYTVPLVLCSIVALILGFYAARHRDRRGALAFMWFCLAAAWWAITYVMEIGSPDLASKIFWSKVEYVGITAGPVIWLAFAIHYTRHDKW